jgi:hypothetical protein
MGPRGRRARRRGLIVGAAVGSAAARRNSDTGSTDASTPVPAADDTVERLEKLAELKEKGILTDEEFQSEKQKILGS